MNLEIDYLWSHKCPKKWDQYTLIALVITIIVLLILAGVTIVTLTGDNGLLTKAGNAKQANEEAEICEQIKLAYSEWQLGQYTGVTDDAATFIKNKLNSIYGEGTVTNVTEEDGILTVYFSNEKEYTYNIATGKSEYIKPVSEYPEIAAGGEAKENSRYVTDGKTAVIPVGYTVSSKTDEQSIDNGLVITKDGNEWVWIPVANITDLYIENTTAQEWKMTGTNEDNKVATKYASKSEILSGQTRTTPGSSSSYREPDTVVGNGTEYDTVEANWTAAGFESFIDMATKLSDDYKKMIASVRRYGGFYVGRYELSSVGTQKNQPSLIGVTWYDLYKKCKEIDNAGVETRMIWGCQWDHVCKFISTYKEENEIKTRSLTDSTTYGNYKDSIEPANTGNYEQIRPKNTGSNEAWKTNNIYDLAGNYWEWTQEAVGNWGRAGRGGASDNGGSNYPVISRYPYAPSPKNIIPSRPVLYIK